MLHFFFYCWPMCQKALYVMSEIKMRSKAWPLYRASHIWRITCIHCCRIYFI